MTDLSTLLAPRGTTGTRLHRLVDDLQAAEAQGRNPWRIFNRYIQDAKRHWRHLQARLLGVEAAETSRYRANAIRHKLVSSADARLIAWDKANRSRRPPHKRSPLELVRAALELNLYRESTETVPLQVVNKPAGDVRVIAKPRSEHRARQQVLKPILRKLYSPLDCQFAAAGAGGRTAAIQMVKSLIKGGFTHTIQLDVRDAYPSSHSDIVTRVLEPLPRSVINSNVLAENMEMEVIPNHIEAILSPLETTRQGRRGLPQGFSSSSAVFHMIVAETMRSLTLPTGVRIVNYADDFLIMARTRREAIEARNTVESAFRRTSGGNIGFTPKGYRLAYWGFEFLKYRIKERSGCTEITVRQERLNSLQARYIVVALETLSAPRFNAHRAIQRLLQRFICANAMMSNSILRTVGNAMTAHQFLIRLFTARGDTEGVRMLRRIDLMEFPPMQSGIHSTVFRLRPGVGG